MNPTHLDPAHIGAFKVRRWLSVIIFFVILMVGLGGVTRLTGSGLSITEWKPIMGAIPPLTDTEWDQAFELYRQIPQFKILNSQMALHEFKVIFFWEYLHRLVGRFIGLIFFFPLLCFFIKKQIPNGFVRPLVFLFFLGGAQGAMGWFMVMSGLSELTSVSHFRLTLHLVLAFLIASYGLWIFKRLGEITKPHQRELCPSLSRVAKSLMLLILIQTIFGGFTAGLKAGFQFPTFPTFNGHWIPVGLFEMEPWIINFVSNPITVQWVHRILATAFVVYAFGQWIKSRGKLNDRGQRQALTAVAHLSATQYILGVLLVLNGVPIWLGVFHQVVGCLLFLLCVNALYEFTTPSLPGPKL